MLLIFQQRSVTKCTSKLNNNRNECTKSTVSLLIASRAIVVMFVSILNLWFSYYSTLSRICISEPLLSSQFTNAEFWGLIKKKNKNKKLKTNLHDPCPESKKFCAKNKWKSKLDYIRSLFFLKIYNNELDHWRELINCCTKLTSSFMPSQIPANFKLGNSRLLIC